MEKFTSLSNIELMYIDGGFNAKGVWHKFTKKIKSCWDSFYPVSYTHLRAHET